MIRQTRRARLYTFNGGARCRASRHVDGRGQPRTGNRSSAAPRNLRDLHDGYGTGLPPGYPIRPDWIIHSLTELIRSSSGDAGRVGLLHPTQPIIGQTALDRATPIRTLCAVFASSDDGCKLVFRRGFSGCRLPVPQLRGRAGQRNCISGSAGYEAK